MPRYARSTKRRGYTRRRVRPRTRRTKTRKSTVTRIARSVTLRLAETKRNATINELATILPATNAATQWYYRPVFSVLEQGTSSHTIVGSEIQYPMAKVKFHWTIDWNAITGSTPDNARYGGVGLNVMLVASNDAVASVLFDLYPNNSLGINNWFYQSNGYVPTMNGNNVKVLKKWSKIYNPDQLNFTGGASKAGISVVRGKLQYRWKRKLTFEDSATIPDTDGPISSRILKGWNYYWLVGFRTPTLLAGAPLQAFPTCYMDSFLYYKDP